MPSLIISAQRLKDCTESLPENLKSRYVGRLSGIMIKPSLEGCASLIRNIGGSCTLLNLRDGYLVAGTKSGKISCWSVSDGSNIWKRDFDGPCNDSEICGPCIYITESNMVHSIDIANGRVNWTVELEGSVDLISADEAYLWVTSSVYNIEIQDFTEGSVCQIDMNGKKIATWPTEGRAWSLCSVDGAAYLGLSRPKCGYCIISHERIEYFPLGHSSPVTVGDGNDVNGVIFGHSDGGSSQLVNGEISTSSARGSSATAIYCSDGWIIGLENGEIHARGDFGSWESKLEGQVEEFSIGPSLDERKVLWASSWGDASEISVFDLASGEVILKMQHSGRVSQMCGSQKVICFGDENGNLLILEAGVFRRRLQEFQPNFVEGDSESVMRRKIRELRRG